jgi:hypothetical protein
VADNRITMRCECGFLVYGNGEAAVHLARAERYGGRKHAFELFKEQRNGERRKTESPEAPPTTSA